jgi:hypothetical protein
MMRLLPWAGDVGQPVYLSTDDGDSFMSRLADDLESTQLALAERTLHSAESAWDGRGPGADMTSMVPHLCHALRDTLRIARSLPDRLSVPDRQGECAAAGAVSARENALAAVYGTPVEEAPLTVLAGPWTVAYRWPSVPGSVSAARRVLRRHLEQWGMITLADTAGLVLSELVTNALRHASGPDDRLVETRYERLPDGSLRIEVHDTDVTKPQRKEPSADSDSGRGLLLVEALTSGRWGVSDRQGVGKMIWAVCVGENTEITP